MVLPKVMPPKHIRAISEMLKRGVVSFKPAIVETFIEHADAQAIFLREAAKELTRNRHKIEALQHEMKRVKDSLSKETERAINADHKSDTHVTKQVSELKRLIDHYKSEAHRLSDVSNKYKAEADSKNKLLENKTKDAANWKNEAEHWKKVSGNVQSSFLEQNKRLSDRCLELERGFAILAAPSLKYMLAKNSQS